MRANRRRDTEPELRIRRLLHAEGMRFRVDLPIRLDGSRPVRPDLVFTRARLAVFVDGCFWHGCSEHKGPSKTNAHYWTPKIASNAARDRRHTRALADAGWTVLRFWEHEPADEVARHIQSVYRRLLDQRAKSLSESSRGPVGSYRAPPGRSPGPSA